METSSSNQALHAEILEGLKRMDGVDGTGRGGDLGELPHILKTILESVQAGNLQPMLQLIDGERQLPPIVGLEEFMKTIVQYPRLAQEFYLHYLRQFTISDLGHPRIGKDGLQGMAAFKEERMADFLSGVGLENQWNMLTDSERRVAYASLFDQLSECLIRAMHSHEFAGGFVEKYAYGKAATDVVES